MREFEKSKLNFTSFTDILFNFLLVFVAIVSLIKVKNNGDPAFMQNAVYQIVMEWPGTSKSDIDLWAQDPFGRLVGFKNREGGEGSLFALNRDDLGDRTEKGAGGNVIPINEEIISLRGTFEGEYIVNGHCYAKKENGPETIKVKLIKVKPFKEIVKKEREFTLDGDEKTFFRFRVDKDGNITETNELQQIITQADES